MCGIVGFMGRANRARLNAFHDMLIWGVVRGSHATGAVGIRNKPYEIVKAPVQPLELMSTQRYATEIDNMANYCVIGHNRYATSGHKDSEDNAHPFNKGNIILVHNGTVRKFGLPDADKFDCDSEAITNAIDKLGIDEAWKLVDGAATLVWWDIQQQALNIISNGTRPIFFSLEENGEAIFFSSELDFHKMAMRRWKLKIHRGESMFPEKDILYTFKYKDKSRMELSGEQRQLIPYSVPVKTNVHHYPSSYNKHWYKGDDDDYSNYESNALPNRYVPDRVKDPGSGKLYDINTQKEILRDEEKPAPEVVNNPRFQSDPYTRRTPQEKYCTEAYFHNTYKGCCFCGASLETEFEESVVIDDRKACCENCFSTAEAEGMSITATSMV